MDDNSEGEMTNNNGKSRDEIILEMRDYAAEQFDKLVVYLNSGALVLTIGFVKDIIEITEETDKSLLIWSWSSFTISLLLILVSHKTAIYSTDFDIKGENVISDRFDIATDFLNWTSYLVLILGIVLFIWFITNNL